VIIAPEIDELWSYVQNKAKQRWLWYALDKISLKVVTYTFGTRCDSTLESLLQKLENYSKVTFYFADGWGSYARLLDSKKHIVSKRYTQRIERSNLNLRTRCKNEPNLPILQKGYLIILSLSWLFYCMKMEYAYSKLGRSYGPFFDKI
jgi:insertion element IS1 protein InsB